MSGLSSLTKEITDLRNQFTGLLMTHVRNTGLSVDMYHRYLSMQYHLTKGVQRYFLTAAAHADLARMRRLRRFLFDFANEEELHYLVAGKDISTLGLPVLPEPIDVQLWHAYFGQVVVTRPFVRLGAACLLENLSSPDNRPLIAKLLQAPFLSPANTKFLVLHMHETLPHGEQILAALSQETLDPRQQDDLVEGARKGGVMYLRMVDWALNPQSRARLADRPAGALPAEDVRDIEQFDVAEIGL